MRCPRCGSRLVGRIGARQYYCWNCFAEFARRGEAWQVYEVDPEGVLVPAAAEGETVAASAAARPGPMAAVAPRTGT